ncbi:cobalt-precorrin-6A reductase [Devosia sp. XK-2]|uniref:cobalt-precorrin-6A reductase n=1 Tax=Devosia sp. XK-2 TaxID=3126689 RepID=UPI0030D1DBFE
MKILILGGTSEARQLADRLTSLGHDVITSLAGRTQDPILPAGRLRMGHFGGVQGLCAFLRAANIECLVDATHPYASQISGNAVAAAAATGIRLVRLLRPAWAPLPGQHWTVVRSAKEAADALPRHANVLLTTGHSGLATFLERQDCQFFVRLIEPPNVAMPKNAQLVLDRPPYNLAGELTLMQRHGITHLVSKNSGGGQTAAKLEAAQQLGVVVLMVARPIYDPAEEVETVEAAISALSAAGA